MDLINNVNTFFSKYKTSVIESDTILNDLSNEIMDFYLKISEDDIKKYNENILLIYGYSMRLENLEQRLFYTFSEAVSAINLDNLMKNNDSLKLNCIVYISVLKYIIDEINGKNIDEEYKITALNEYKKLEEKKAKENKKYHVYQY